MFTFYFFVLICSSRHNVANSIAYLLLPMNGGKSVGFTINSSPKSTQSITTANLKLTLILTLVLTLSPILTRNCYNAFPRRPVKKYTQALPSCDVMSSVYTLGRLGDYGFTVMVRRFRVWGRISVRINSDELNVSLISHRLAV